MKTPMRILLTLLLITGTLGLMAQQTKIDNMRSYDKDATGVFEDAKTSTDFTGLRVRVGGGFAQQYQSLSHSNSGGADLYDLQPGFNLATANLNLDVQLADGIRLNLITYLSARHHPEAWVKGGYIQFDKLPFDGFDAIMEKVTIRVGHMEVNYGDTHFRRTDNGNALYNPFVGNYIVDAFNTEIGGEIYYKDNGLVAMLGLTGGEINGNISTARTSDVDDSDKKAPSIIGKFGYDSGDNNEDVRFRIMSSIYTTSSSSANHIYDGDRGGSRYYLVMSEPGSRASSDFRTGRYNPGFSDKVTAVMFNAFLEASGFELFATYETASGRTNAETDTRKMNQLGFEALYRFGGNENFYLGGRYNTVTADDLGAGQEISINRTQLGGGWFVSPNVLFKLEYVNQNFNDFNSGNILHEGNFKGIMVEAAVGF